jgi:hypothetical protein
MNVKETQLSLQHNPSSSYIYYLTKYYLTEAFESATVVIINLGVLFNFSQLYFSFYYLNSLYKSLKHEIHCPLKRHKILKKERTLETIFSGGFQTISRHIPF